MNKTIDSSLLEMFGLTYEQSILLFSTEKMITDYDIRQTKSMDKAIIKTSWLVKWVEGINAYLGEANHISDLTVELTLQDMFKKEIKKSNNRSWYYILVLECLTFSPYTPLGCDKDKQYQKCKYDAKKCKNHLIEFFCENGLLSKEEIERLDKVYSKNIDKISGKLGKVAIGVLSVIAITALAATGAAIFAPKIAVALFGAQFAGLHGAALTSACLALAGSGVIGAVAGGGMLGGTVLIAGGGALLGLAGGGTAAGIVSAMLQSSPKYALTQAAKLETILKEVVLNAQQDVVSAQKIISLLQNQINELNKKLTELETVNENNKKEINNIKESIKYLKNACKDMNIFTSAYATGLEAAK